MSYTMNDIQVYNHFFVIVGMTVLKRRFRKSRIVGDKNCPLRYVNDVSSRLYAMLQQVFEIYVVIPTKDMVSLVQYKENIIPGASISFL